MNDNGERDAGIQIPSEKDRELAAKRGAIFQGLLSAYMEANGMEAPPVELAAPVEDFLDDDEVAQLDAMVATLNENRIDVIELFNRQPKMLPPEVEKFLTDVLTRERKVVVTIESSKTVAVQQPGEESPGQPPTVENSPGTQEDKKHDKLSISMTLLAGPVSVFVRRKKDETTPPPKTPPKRPPIPEPQKTPRPTRAPIKLDHDPTRNGAAREQFKQKPIKRKMIRPHSMHGTNGPNYDRGRDRGGSLGRVTRRPQKARSR